MRIVRELPRRAIDRFGSCGFEHVRLAAGDLQVAVAELDGTIGAHEAPSAQLVVVLSGRVEVSSRDELAELSPFEGVVWEQGEWHEARSLAPSLLLLVEGDVAALAGLLPA